MRWKLLEFIARAFGACSIVQTGNDHVPSAVSSWERGSRIRRLQVSGLLIGTATMHTLIMHSHKYRSSGHEAHTCTCVESACEF